MYEQLLEKFISDWQEHQAKLATAIANLPYLPYQCKTDMWGDVKVMVPWNDKDRGAVLAALKEAGWQQSVDFFSETNGQHVWTFYKEIDESYIHADVIMTPDLEGSVCHKVEIGEVVVTNKIYEVVCND